MRYFNSQYKLLLVLDSYTKISSSLPHAILVNDADGSDNEEEEITVDV